MGCGGTPPLAPQNDPLLTTQTTRPSKARAARVSQHEGICMTHPMEAPLWAPSPWEVSFPIPFVVRGGLSPVGNRSMSRDQAVKRLV